MNFQDTLDELNTLLGDAADVTFTPEEKERALTKAWRDHYVVNTVWDSSLLYTTDVSSYALPATLTTLKDIYLSRGNDSTTFPEPIDSNLWEIVNGSIKFAPLANNIIPNAYRLYLKGNYKITTSDTITNTSTQEYVINLAGLNTLTLLGFKKANLFLKNDLTMGELIALRRELANDVKQDRLGFQKEYETA